MFELQWKSWQTKEERLLREHSDPVNRVKQTRDAHHEEATFLSIVRLTAEGISMALDLSSHLTN